MKNIQHRVIDAPAPAMGVLLDRMARDDDPIWPAPAWPALRLDAGLTPGSRGGHGPIGYSVAEYEPGRRIRFAFDPKLGINGYHELVITPDGPVRCRLTHTISGRTEGRMLLLWPLVIRWMHEALIHDLFDNAERAATGRLSGRPSRWTPWVRLLRRTKMPRPRAVALPTGAHLAAGTLGQVELMDAWQLPNLTAGRTASDWTDAIFTDGPSVIRSLLHMRNRLGRVVGLDLADGRTMFQTLAADEHEVLLGGDNRDFTLRISVHVTPDKVTCSTLTRAHNRRGRSYLAFIRLVHPVVVRSMLRRALRTGLAPAT